MATAHVHAATYTISVSGGEWGDGTTWSGGVVPTTADLAVINVGRSVVVGTAVGTTAGNVAITNNSIGPNTVTVNSGGSLSVNGTFSVGHLTQTGAGFLNVTGGALTLLNAGLTINAYGNASISGGSVNAQGAITNTGVFNLSGGSFTDTRTGGRNIANGTGGVYNISGGTFTATGASASDTLSFNRGTYNISGGTIDLTGGQVIFVNTPTFNVIGDASTINVLRWNGAYAQNVNFNFGASGISTINGVGAFASLANSTITVDGTNYTGAAGSFTLFSSSNLLATPLSATASNFDGYTTALSQSGTNYIITLTAYSSVWDGGGGDTNINTAGNWADDGTPNLTNGLNTFTFGTGGSTATINTNMNAAGIVLNRASSFTIASGAGSLTVGSGGITTSNAAHTIESGVILGADQTWSTGTGLTVNGSVQGGHAITKSGAGALTLNGANTFSGGVSLSGGTLNLGHASALGAGALSVSAASTIANTSGGALTLANDLVVSTVNPVSFSAANPLTISGGVTLGADSIISVTAGSLTLSGVVSGAYKLNKFSAGDLTLGNDSNSFSGGLFIQNGGKLNVSSIANSGANSAAGSGSSIEIFTNGILVYTGAGDTTNRTITLGGTGGSTITNNGSGALVFTGAVNYTKSVSNNLFLTGTNTGDNRIDGVMSDNGANTMGLYVQGGSKWILAGNNTYTGDTVVQGGSTLQIGNGGTSGSAASTFILQSSNLVFNRSDTLTVSTAINGAGGNVAQNGSGTVVLNAANAYTGTTTINSGTLQAAAANAMGGTTNVIVATGGSLLVTADNAINDSAAMELAGGTLEFSGNIDEYVGALTLSANSVIDMGGGNVALEFSNLVTQLTSTTRLDIYNYTLYSDHIRFASNANLSDSLQYISFYSGFGTGFIGNSFIEGLNPYEIRPVPEPETWATAVLLLISGGLWIWRTRQQNAPCV